MLLCRKRQKKENVKAFLFVIGKEGRELFNTFFFAKEQKDKLEPLLEKFESYCLPKKNVTMQRHKFNPRTQGSTELIDQFVTVLKNIAGDCEFGDIKMT